MPLYTPEKIDNCIKSTTAAIEQHHKVTALYAQMLRTFKRIRFAMMPDFKTYIKELEEEEINKILKERAQLNKTDPLGVPRTHPRHAARQRIMKNSEFFKVYPYEMPRWQDYIFEAEKTHDKDRKQLIKEGKIEDIKTEG